MSTLFIVATPIGNLEDVSFRAIRILKEADFVLCEDTRVTGRLLAHYQIKTPVISYHQHSDLKKIDYILSLLAAGKNLALVSDAGTPAISDPGGKLIEAVLKKMSESVKIEAVPGPSALTAALSISGLPTDKFIFMGFPPHKKGRETFLRRIVLSEWPVVVYESKHRIIKFLEELKKLGEAIKKESEEKKRAEVNGWKKKSKKEAKIIKKDLTSVVVCRELSKMHETVYRGEIKNIIEKIKNNQDEQRGEFVVIVG